MGRRPNLHKTFHLRICQPNIPCLFFEFFAFFRYSFASSATASRSFLFFIQGGPAGSFLRQVDTLVYSESRCTVPQFTTQGHIDRWSTLPIFAMDFVESRAAGMGDNYLLPFLLPLDTFYWGISYQDGTVPGSTAPQQYPRIPTYSSNNR